MVTPSIDGSEFKVTLEQKAIAALVAGVEFTSLRALVEVNREDLMDGSRELCAVAYITMVALDKDGRPKPVPPEST